MSDRRLIRGWSLLLLAGLGLPVSEAHGQDLKPVEVPNAFRDLRIEGGLLLPPLDDLDDGGIGVLLGFDFQFFGQTYDQVTITSNGYLTFGNAVNGLNEPIPEAFPPNALIAPFWDDLDMRPHEDAELHFERRGEPGSMSFSVQWSNLALKSDPAARLTFQVLIYQDTGEIQFHYGPMTNGDGSTGTGGASGASATIGLENGTGTGGIEISYNTAGAVSSGGRGFAFLPGPALPEGQQLGDLDGDGQITVIDQSKLIRVGSPHFPPLRASELVAADIHPQPTDATTLWGDGAVNQADRDLLSLVIVGRANLSPYLSELLPPSPAPGATLTLTGSRFDTSDAAKNSVTLTAAGGTTVTLPAATVNPSGTRLTVTLPPTARRGLVYVTTNDRRTNAQLLGVSGIPAITSLQPRVAILGESITITGVEFPPTEAGTTVTIGGVQATVTAVTQGPEDTITATVPPTLGAGTFPLLVSSATATSEPFGLSVGDLPVAEITLPTDDTVIRDRYTITGTATDPSDFLRYELSYAPLDGGEFITFHEGTTPVSNGDLGTFDPTLLVNGFYRLRLTVTDALGLTATDETTFSVEGFVKLGHFSLSFLDLEIPASGIAIRVLREYDSRDKVSRDFGYGWRLRLATLDLQEEFQKAVIVQNPLSARVKYEFKPTQNNPLDIRFWTAEYETADKNERSTIDFEVLPGVDPGNRDLFRDNVGNYGWFPEAIPFDPEVYRITQFDGTVLRVADERAPQPGLLQLIKPTGISLTITRDGIIHSKGRSVTFERDQLDRITRIVDPNGNAIRYGYDPAGDLVTWTDAEDFTTTFTYREDHHLIEWFNPEGVQVTKNEYDDAGRLIATIDPFGKRLEFDHDITGRREIARDRLGRPTITDYDERGRSVRMTGPDGKFEAFTYNDLDQILTKVDRNGELWTYEYDAVGNQTAHTDPEGNRIEYTFDARGNMLTAKDADGGLTTFTYNDDNLVTGSTDPGGGTTSRTYDDDGNLLSFTDEVGQVTRYEYDERGDLIVKREPNGQVTQYDYDDNGNRLTSVEILPVDGGPAVRRTTSYAYNSKNQRTTVTRPDGTTQVKRYGVGGRIVSQTDAGGRRVTLAYDEAGRLVQRIGDDGRTEVREYDDNGNVTAIKNEQGRKSCDLDVRGRVTKITFANQVETTFEYDDADNMTARTDARGNRWQFEYDAARRKTKEIDPAGNETTFTYDGKGNLRTRTDPDNNTTTYDYDALGRLLKTTFPNGREASIERDLAGRITKRTDVYGRVSEFVYDTYDEEEQITFSEGFTRYTRDSLGRVTAQTDLRGNTTSFAYDPTTGERLSITLPLGQTASFTYQEGQVTTRTDFNGQTTSLSHDGNGNLVYREFPDGTGERLTWNPAGDRVEIVEVPAGETRYEWDDTGRLTRRIESDGRTIAYTYDANDNVLSVTTPAGEIAYTYDAHDRLKTVTDPGNGVTTYTYTPGGRLERIDRPNGISTAVSTDSMGVLQSLTHRDAANVVLASYTYTYNPEGLRSRVTEHSGRVVDYTYDAFARLTQETITEGPAVTTIAYAYDAVGNRESKTTTRPDGTIETVTYTHDINDRLTQEDVTDTAGGGSTSTVTYTYDDNGNCLTRTSPGDSATYTYDALNRLTGAVVVRGANRDEIAYRYDHFGNRIQTVKNGVVTNHLVDTVRPISQSLLDTDADGNTVRSFTYGRSIEPLSLADSSGTRSYHLQDGQMSVRHVADGAGALAQSYTYDAYGVELSSSGSLSNPIGYVGEYAEPETGLVYLRSRWLDPRNGRFQTRDTFEGFPYDPPSLHPYAYGQGNPVNSIDPPGTFSFTLVGLFAFDLPMWMEMFDWQRQMIEARAFAYARRVQGALKLQDILGSLNLFLPNTLDLVFSDKDRVLAESLIARSFGPEARKRATGYAPLPGKTARTFLFGAKVYGRMGSDLQLGSARSGGGNTNLTPDERLRRDEILYPDSVPGDQQPPSREVNTPLLDEVLEWLGEMRASGAVTDINLGEYQHDSNGNQVGYNRPDLQFTVVSTDVRWCVTFSGTDSLRVNQIDRILANDPRVVACEFRSDTTFEDFMNAYRWNCDLGPPANFILSINTTENGFQEIVKDAIPQRNKRTPLPQGKVIAGSSVLAHNGEYVLSRTDMKVKGRGLTWEFSRTYRSGLVFQNEPGVTGLKAKFHLGHNWSTNYDRRIGNAGQGAFLEIDPLGRYSDTYRRRLEAEGLDHEDPPGIFASVIRDAVAFKQLLNDGEEPVQTVALGYRRRLANGVMEAYDDAGWLVEIRDPHDNTIQLVRDRNRVLKLAIDSLGRRYTYHYVTVGGGKVGSQQFLKEVVDVTGNRKVVFDYDANLDLVAATSPAGRREEYVYAQKQTHPALQHNLTQVIFPQQVADLSRVPVLINTYKASEPGSFDFDSVITQQYGGTIEVDAIPSGKKLVAAGGTFQFKYTEINVARLVSDTNGLASTTECTDRRGNTTIYEFNKGGNPIKVTDEAGFVTTHLYNNDGLRVRTQLPNGQTEYFGYNTASEVSTARVQMIYRAAFPAPRAGENFQAIVTEFDYDPFFNQLLRTTQTQGFNPVFDPPPANLEDARNWLVRNPTEYEHFTNRNIYDWQEGPRPALPFFLRTKFKYDMDKIVQDREQFPLDQRWRLEFNLGDVNGDGERGPTGLSEYAGAGFRGLVVGTRNRAVRLNPNSLEAVRLGDTLQVARTATQYNEHGQVTLRVDAEGNVSLFEYFSGSGYDPQTGSQPGYLRAVVNDTDSTTAPIARTTSAPPTRVEIRSEYDGFGNVRRLIDGRGNETSFHYDPDGLLLEQRVAANVAALNYVTRYAYDMNTQLVRSEFEDRDGSNAGADGFYRLRTTYDILNNPVEEATQLTRDTWLVTTHTYDPGELRTSTTFPEGNRISWDYDARMLTTAERRAPGTTLESVTRWSYDRNRNPVEHFYPDGDKAMYEYDGFDRMHRVIAPNGSVQQTDYDVEGHSRRLRVFGSPGGPTPSNNDESRNVLLSDTRVVRDDMYRAIEARERVFGTGLVDQEAVTRTEFDRLGRSTVSEEPDGERIVRTFDGLSRLIESRDALGNRLQSTFDANNNVISQIVIEKSTIPGVPDESFQTRFELDALNRVTRITDPIGQVSRFRYDSRNNLIFASDPVGPVLPDGSNDHGNIHLFEFDAANRKIKETQILQPSGIGSGLSNPARDTSNPMNPDGEVTLSYVYDNNSRLTALIDDNGNRTQSSYDALNRVVRSVNADGTSFSYTYNTDDTVRTVTDPNGTLSEHTYDVSDRLTRLSVARGEGVVGTTLSTFEYDGLDRITRSTDDNGSGPDMVAEWRYDSLSRVLEEIQNGRAFRNTWDIDSKRLACRYPSGRVIADTFDAIDRPVLREDQTDALTPRAIASWDYIGPESRVLRRENGNGTTLSFLEPGAAPTQVAGYDSLRRVTRLRHHAGDGTNLVDHEYTYNRANVRTSTKRNEDGGLTDRYTFDSMYRVVQSALDQDPTGSTARRSVAALSYTLDGVGNRRTQESTERAGGSSTKTFSVNEMNEYTEIGGVIREYSSNGNLIDDGSRLYRYDYRNRLVEVARKDGGLVARYAYDAQNRRTRTRSFAVPSVQGHCGSDSVGYQAIKGTGGFEDIRSSGQELTLQGGTLAEHPIGFAFAFHGDRVSSTTVHADGHITFPADSIGPNVAPTIAAFRNSLDLSSRPSSEIHSAVLGSKPSRRFIVQWSDVGLSSDTQASLTFQIVLFEGSDRIEFRYDNMTNGDGSEGSGAATGEGAFIGIAALNGNPTLVVNNAEDCFVTTGDKITIGAATTTFLTSAVTDYLYDGWRVCEERSGGGSTLATFVYDTTYVDAIIQLERGEAHPQGRETLYLHQDVRYDVVAVTDSTGTVVERRVYDDYGNSVDQDKATTQSSAVGNPYGFQGRRLDPETGFYYFRNRYYDPGTGRFLQRDPMWDPGSVGNQYTFAWNNPISQSDPSGEIVPVLIGLAIAAGVGAILGGAMAAVRQAIDIAADPKKSFSKDWDWGKVGEGVLEGAKMGAIVYLFPKLAIAMVALGVASGIAEIAQGNVAVGVFDIATSIAPFGKKPTFSRFGKALGRTLSNLSGKAMSMARARAAAVKCFAKTQWRRDGTRYCFLAGTLVLTQTGAKPIEDVTVGERVLSRDPETGKQGFRRVTRLFPGNTKQVTTVTYASRQSGRTESHSVGSSSNRSGGDDEEPGLSASPPSIQTIRCTPGHDFFRSSTNTWIDAGDLRPGDLLLGSEGETLVVVAVATHEESVRTYNFEVAGWHTYFVSEAPNGPAALVHNLTCTPQYIGRGVYRTQHTKGGVATSVLTNGGRPSGAYKHRGSYYPGTKVKIDTRGNPIFKSPFSMRIKRADFWKSDSTHFELATVALRARMYKQVGGKWVRKKTAEARKLFKLFDRHQLAEIRAGKDAPDGWTWHHHQQLGKLQLVRTADHAPVSHIGGRSIWGGGREAR